jgi:hypothetical protein
MGVLHSVCNRGHVLTEENVVFLRKGVRRCRICWEKYKQEHAEASRKYSREYRQALTSAFRHAKWIAWAYGLTPEKQKEMYDQQGGKCAIPSCPNPAEHIDHDHKTKKVRALLCQKCNRGLGHFNDDVTLLQEAIQYLESYSNG